MAKNWIAGAIRSPGALRRTAGVKDGEKTKMKAFGEVLSDDEIKALVKHMRSFKK